MVGKEGTMPPPPPPPRLCVAKNLCKDFYFFFKVVRFSIPRCEWMCQGHLVWQTRQLYKHWRIISVCMSSWLQWQWPIMLRYSHLRRFPTVLAPLSIDSNIWQSCQSNRPYSNRNCQGFLQYGNSCPIRENEKWRQVRHDKKTFQVSTTTLRPRALELN